MYQHCEVSLPRPRNWNGQLDMPTYCFPLFLKPKNGYDAALVSPFACSTSKFCKNDAPQRVPLLVKKWAFGRGDGRGHHQNSTPEASWTMPEWLFRFRCWVKRLCHMQQSSSSTARLWTWLLLSPQVGPVRLSLLVKDILEENWFADFRTDQQVFIYRLNGQRVYGASSQKPSTLKVDSIQWKPNGLFLQTLDDFDAHMCR